MHLKQYKKSELLLQEALGMCRNLSNIPKVATILNDLGTLMYEIQDYQRAEGFYSQALELAKKKWGKLRRGFLYRQSWACCSCS